MQSYHEANLRCRLIRCYRQETGVFFDSILTTEVLQDKKECDVRDQLLNHLAPSKFSSQQLNTESGKMLSSLVERAFAEPIHYPSLTETVIAGDRVAIALMNGLPQAKELLSVVVGQLNLAGIANDDIVVVISPAMAEYFGFGKSEIDVSTNQDEKEAPPLLVKNIGDAEIHIQIHSIFNQSGVSYVAANEGGDPIYFNRQLVDADVVLPIGFPVASHRQDFADPLYPEFSTLAIRDRMAEEASVKVKRAEIQLANDSLGSFFQLQVVSGPGGEISDVFFGNRKDVIDAANSVYLHRWTLTAKEADADFVLVTIEQSVGAQSWADFVQSVLVAGRCAKDNAPIAVWSEIEEKPNRQLRNMFQSQFDRKLATKLSPELEQVGQLIEDHPIYLHCKLSRNEVESLGLGFIDSAAEINRIAENAQQAMLIRDAHWCQVSLEEND